MPPSGACCDGLTPGRAIAVTPASVDGGTVPCDGGPTPGAAGQSERSAPLSRTAAAAMAASNAAWASCGCENGDAPAVDGGASKPAGPSAGAADKRLDTAALSRPSGPALPAERPRPPCGGATPRPPLATATAAPPRPRPRPRPRAAAPAGARRLAAGADCGVPASAAPPPAADAPVEGVTPPFSPAAAVPAFATPAGADRRRATFPVDPTAPAAGRFFDPPASDTGAAAAAAAASDSTADAAASTALAAAIAAAAVDARCRCRDCGEMVLGIGGSPAAAGPAPAPGAVAPAGAPPAAAGPPPGVAAGPVFGRARPPPLAPFLAAESLPPPAP